jgi:uncharacterized protein (TIGR02271 family)
MITLEQARTLQGKTMYGADGDKLGSIDVLYADREDGEPTFATVNTGLLGTSTSFVPLAQAELRGDDVHVPYSKDLVKDAPSIDQDAELAPEEEERLYAHYSLSGGTGTGTATGTATGTTTTDTTDTTTRTDQSAGNVHGTTGRDTSGPTTDDAMTRSEEQLKVGTQQTEAGRARLRKFVVTEQQSVNVPVSHEEVRIEREPITDANAGKALDGPAISEEEHEVVLHAETPVVQKEAVPVERVRLGKETVTDEQQVTEEVRKEQIDTDGVRSDGTYPTEGGAQGTTDRDRDRI